MNSPWKVSQLVIASWFESQPISSGLTPLNLSQRLTSTHSCFCNQTQACFFIQLKWPFQFSSVQLLSRVRLFATPWTAARQASLSITNTRSLPKLMSIESMMPSNHLIICGPLFHLHSIFPNIRVFSSESALRIRWPKYWHFSFNISPSKGHPGPISFMMDWLDLLAVQGTLKSLLQHHSSKVQNHQFFSAQLSLWSNSHIYAWLLEKP